MKKLLVMAAFVAGPILYAQQKPISATELQKDEILQKEQSKTIKATPLTPATEVKSVNLSDTPAAKKTSTKKTEATTPRKGAKASSFKSTVEN